MKDDYKMKDKTGLESAMMPGQNSPMTMPAQMGSNPNKPATLPAHNMPVASMPSSMQNMPSGIMPATTQNNTMTMPAATHNNTMAMPAQTFPSPVPMPYNAPMTMPEYMMPNQNMPVVMPTEMYNMPCMPIMVCCPCMVNPNCPMLYSQGMAPGMNAVSPMEMNNQYQMY